MKEKQINEQTDEELTSERGTVIGKTGEGRAVTERTSEGRKNTRKADE